MRAVVGLLTLVSATTVPVSAAAQQPQERADSLELEMRALKARVDSLEQTLERLMAQRRDTVPPRDELAALRAAARAAVRVDTTAQTEAAKEPQFVSRTRNLNRLNPEISFTGDLVGTIANSEENFEAREFELDLQAVLDPFSTTKWTLAFGEEEVEIEEGYLAYNSLPGGFSLRAGKMRQTFGAVNRIHRHALPQTDYPLVLEQFFGDEGLAQTGVSFEWLVPRPWSSANEVTLQITDGASEPFGEDSFQNPVTLLNLKNYWDLTPAAYFEWGLSGAAGSPEPGLDSRIFGSDLTFSWQPPAR